MRDSRGRFLRGQGGRTTERDLGYGRIRAALDDMRGAHVVVGWTEGPDHPDAGLPMAGLAAIHEFGAPARNIPERSTLRATADAKLGDYRQQLRDLAGEVVAGRATAEGALARFGAGAASDVQQAITTFTDPALSPVTIARKGSSQPLIDRGALRDAVTSQVRTGRAA